MDNRFGSVSVALYLTIGMRRELSRRTDFWFTCWSVFCTLTCGNELWVVIEQKKTWIHSFFRDTGRALLVHIRRSLLRFGGLPGISKQNEVPWQTENPMEGLCIPSSKGTHRNLASEAKSVPRDRNSGIPCLVCHNQKPMGPHQPKMIFFRH